MLDLSLDVIVVDRDFRMLQMPDQLRPLTNRVRQCFTERTVRRRAGQQLIDPRFELLQDGLGLLLAQREHRLPRQRLAALMVLFLQRLDLTLHLIDLADIGLDGNIRQRAARTQLADLSGLEEHRAAMLLIQEARYTARSLLLAQHINDRFGLVLSYPRHPAA